MINPTLAFLSSEPRLLYRPLTLVLKITTKIDMEDFTNTSTFTEYSTSIHLTFLIDSLEVGIFNTSSRVMHMGGVVMIVMSVI